MSNTKNTPDNKGTDQRGKDTSFGNTAGRTNTTNQPSDRSATDETRNAGQPGTQRKGAETTQAGSTDRNTSNAPSTNKVSGDRSDREVAGSRTTGQNPTGTRDTKDGELGYDDEEDTGAPRAAATDDATADDEAAPTATK